MGLELDPAQIAKTGPTALKIAMCGKLHSDSHMSRAARMSSSDGKHALHPDVAGIAVPFALGAGVSVLLHKELSKVRLPPHLPHVPTHGSSFTSLVDPSIAIGRVGLSVSALDQSQLT